MKRGRGRVVRARSAEDGLATLRERTVGCERETVGRIAARARVTERVVPGVAAMPLGLGERAGGGWSVGIGSNPLRPLALVTEARELAIDVLVCPHCGRTRIPIALATDGLVVREILAHPVLSTESPARVPARPPLGPGFAWWLAALARDCESVPTGVRGGSAFRPRWRQPIDARESCCTPASRPSGPSEPARAAWAGSGQPGE